MARRNRYDSAKEKRDGRRFVPIPIEVLESVAYRSLPARAKALLLDMASQYRGNNNGDICAAFSTMRRFNWRSEQTLFAARRDLEKSGLIFETRKGARPNKPTLFGFTFYGLDEHPKLDISARGFPRGLWQAKNPLPPIAPKRGAILAAKSVVQELV